MGGLSTCLEVSLSANERSLQLCKVGAGYIEATGAQDSGGKGNSEFMIFRPIDRHDLLSVLDLNV